uniref:PRORP domain-containing protein n=1 Tax=Meloidogyne incognita TaxID=6306 RepID=A0A914LE45_MELIC
MPLKNICRMGCQIEFLEKIQAKANQRFYKTLDNLIIQTKSLKNSKPLIVDGLNLARGVYRHERFPYFNKIIVEMIEKKFFPILIISKTPFTYFYQNKLQKLPNVKLFGIEKEFKSKSEINRKYSTQDDLFAINSALYLGPNTHLLSNDNFVDHIGSSHFLPEIAPLFKIWRETRCISFIPEETGEEKFFKLPNPFYAQIQGDALCGYHIFVKDKTDDIFNHVRDELVYCVRTK